MNRALWVKFLKTNEKQEGLLKRQKSIDNKTDNQLDLIRDQGNRQLDLIKDQKNKQPDSVCKTKGINKKIKSLINRIIEETEENESQDLSYTVSRDKKHDFNHYKKLFGKK